MSEESRILLEREYVVPLRDAYRAPRKKRTKAAVRILREFVARHAKTQDVWISNKVNEALWSRSAESPPRRIRVVVRKVEVEGEEGKKEVAEVYLPEELAEGE